MYILNASPLSGISIMHMFSQFRFIFKQCFREKQCLVLMRSRVLVNRGSALTWPRCQSLRCDWCFSFLSAKSVLIQGCEDLAPCVLGKPCPFDSLCWSSVGLEQLGSVLCGRERACFRRRAVPRHRQVTVALRPVALAPPVTLTSVGAIHSVSFVTVLLVWRSRPHGNLRIPEAGRWIRQDAGARGRRDSALLCRSLSHTTFAAGHTRASHLSLQMLLDI